MKKLVVVARSASYLAETELPFLLFLRANGWEPVLAATPDSGVDLLKSNGFAFRSLPRAGVFRSFRISLLCLTVRPALVHLFSDDGAARTAFLVRRPIVISLTRVREALARRSIFSRFRWRYLALNRRVQLLFESQGDFDAVRSLVKGASGWLVRGPVVDTHKFSPPREERLIVGSPLVRILCGVALRKDAGLGELRQACMILKAKKVSFELLLSGSPAEGDPMAISAEELKEWQREGWMKHVGRVDSLDSLLRSAEIALSPSPQPGLPRFLVAAASCARAIIAADTAGPAELIVSEKSGMLFRPGDAPSLARAIEKMVLDSELRDRLGKNARAAVEAHYDANFAHEKIRKVYEGAVGG
jgi:glycosyltransferase involved in cell wall biosynthesis